MSQESKLGRSNRARRVWRLLLVYSLDLSAFALSTFLAFELRLGHDIPARYFHPMEIALSIWAAAKFVSFVVCAVNRGSWRRVSVHDAVRIVVAVSAGSMLGGLAIFLLFGPSEVPHTVYILDWLLSCMLALGGRLAVRLILSARRMSGDTSVRTRTLIYGAGTAGLQLLREVQQNRTLLCDVIGFVDDDLSKVGMNVHGKRVFGTGDELETLVRKHAIARLLIALPKATGPQMVRILKLATDANVEYKMVPSLGELIQSTELGKQIREVAVEDLLGRKPVQLDMNQIRDHLQGRVVMVTGAAGSIGSELCRHIARFRPLAIIGFDEAETPLFNIDREMAASFPNVVFHPEIGSITSQSALKRVMLCHRPSVVFHAAAYKHVPLMERHVFSAVETNILGTWNAARTAIECGVGDFVMISTDKAVRPTNMMGATKRMAELLIRALQMESDTKFVAVRFGNVLGSNGSVIPIFKEQIAAGGPVTVTHPDVCRYFMTIPEAVQLVLQAFSIGKGGEIFVLEMGDPVKIADLAGNLILLSGFQPGREIEIQYTGLRPGEKMFEELNLQDENLVPTSHAQIRSYVGNSNLDGRQMKAYIQRLRQIAEQQDIASLLLLLRELIPDYTPAPQLLRAASLYPESNHADSEKILVPSVQIETKSQTIRMLPAILNHQV